MQLFTKDRKKQLVLFYCSMVYEFRALLGPETINTIMVPDCEGCFHGEWATVGVPESSRGV